MAWQRPGAAVAAALRRTGARTVVVDAYDDAFARAVVELQPDVPELDAAWVLGDAIPGGDAPALPTISPAMGALVLPTSGTTGEPKGALLSHRAVTADARLVGHRMGLWADDIWLTAMPLHRSGGCGTTVVACLATVAWIFRTGYRIKN